jgi:hypothetical protein
MEQSQQICRTGQPRSLSESSAGERHEWSLSRRHLNHQMLKNQIINRLSAFLQADESDNEADQRSDIEWLRRDWSVFKQEAKMLCDQFSSVYSPTALLSPEVVGEATADFIELLGTRLHCEWVARRHVDEWRSKMQEKMENIEIYITSDCIEPPFPSEFVTAALSGCRELSRLLNEFPAHKFPL